MLKQLRRQVKRQKKKIAKLGEIIQSNGILVNRDEDKENKMSIMSHRTDIGDNIYLQNEVE